MSKPRIPSTREGYAIWKERSVKDVLLRHFAYTFKGIELEDIYVQDDPQDNSREVQKFVYDIYKKELHVTFSDAIQSSVIDVFVNMIRKSLEAIPAGDECPCYYTNAVSGLFQNISDEGERYRLLGDLLITTGIGPTFAVETCVQQSSTSIKDKVKKWFLLPSIVGMVLVQLSEINGYKKPTAHPREDDVFLSSSWAWCNYIEDVNEGVDLYDCTKPITFAGHVWFESLICVFELYERDASSKRNKCIPTKRYEFIMTGSEPNLEVTEECEAFQERLSQLWREAVDGDSLEGFNPIEFDRKRLAECIGKARLRTAYERYRQWFMSSPKHSASFLGKRHREGVYSQDECSVDYWEKTSYL